MKGRYYANIFIHFEPTGRPLNSEPDYKFEWSSELPPYLPRLAVGVEVAARESLRMGQGEYLA
jgi:hypothetical protein